MSNDCKKDFDSYSFIRGLCLSIFLTWSASIFAEIDRAKVGFGDESGNRIYAPVCNKGDKPLTKVIPMMCAPSLSAIKIPDLSITTEAIELLAKQGAGRLVRCKVKFPPTMVKVECSWDYEVDGGMQSILDAIKECKSYPGDVYAHRIYNSSACSKYKVTTTTVDVDFQKIIPIDYEVEDFSQIDSPSPPKYLCERNLIRFEKVAVGACRKASAKTLPQGVVGFDEGEPAIQHGTICCLRNPVVPGEKQDVDSIPKLHKKNKNPDTTELH